MTRQPTPHDFLLHLRGTAPALARRLDGITGLAFTAGVLGVRAPDRSWTARELEASRDALAAAAATFFGPDTRLEVEHGPADPERLPFPVLASKVWNHVAFWAPGRAVLAVRKPVYLERWLPLAGDPDRVRDEARTTAFWKDFPGDAAPGRELPSLLDDLCELGRAELSYVQLVTPFPGDAAAEALESRLYAVKEWGTPRTPAPIFAKYVGRLHYVDPASPPLGIRVLVGS